MAQAIARSTDTVHMVREETSRNGKIRVIEAHLPCGKGWMNGNKGALDWINLNVGWRSYDEYYASKNHDEAEVKRNAAIETDDKYLRAQAEADRMAALDAEEAAKAELGAKKTVKAVAKEKVK
jgi:hypothetical protein